jgi:hypothetical protein
MCTWIARLVRMPWRRPDPDDPSGWRWEHSLLYDDEGRPYDEREGPLVGGQNVFGERGLEPDFEGLHRRGARYDQSNTRIPGPYVGKGPKGYVRPDERIYEEVCERLARFGHLDASDIEVAVKNGEVSLTGSVRDRDQKRLAEDLADGVIGVKDVHNLLRIRPQPRAASSGG